MQCGSVTALKLVQTTYPASCLLATQHFIWTLRKGFTQITIRKLRASRLASFPLLLRTSPASAWGMWLFGRVRLIDHVGGWGLLGLLLRRYLMLAMSSIVRTLPITLHLFSVLLLSASISSCCWWWLMWMVLHIFMVLAMTRITRSLSSNVDLFIGVLLPLATEMCSWHLLVMVLQIFLV